MRIRPITACSLLLSLLSSVGATAQSPTLTDDPMARVRAAKQAGKDEMAALRAERMAQARWQMLVAPFYSLADGHDTRLLLVNRFAEPLDFDLSISSADGVSRPLTSLRLAPREHVDLDLRTLVGPADRASQTGSLHVRFLGDDEMTQAWTVLSGPNGVMETPLENNTDRNHSAWLSFWDLRSYGSRDATRPHFAFHNADDRTVALTFEVTDLEGQTHSWTREVQAKGNVVVHQAGDVDLPKAGHLTVRHDGTPGRVSGIGFLFGGRVLAQLPLATPSEVHEFGTFDSPVLPFGDAQAEWSSTQVTLFHPTSAKPGPVDVRLLDFETGRVLFEETRELGPSELWSFDLAERARAALVRHDGRLRLQVVGAPGSIFPSVIALGEEGQGVDVAMIARNKVHESGTYPLPNVRENNITTTLVNLGDRDAEIVSQLTWPGGTYALEPFSIRAGGGHRISFRALIESAKADLLDRQIDPTLEDGFFQWHARGDGSRSLIARTEIQRPGMRDVYGMNCFGCCEEMPFGAISPPSIGFDIGQNPVFNAVELIDTCAGTIGPFDTFTTSRTYSAPLSWNGDRISSTGYANDNVFFTGDGDYMWFSCVTRHRSFFGGGGATVDKCFEDNGPDGPFDQSQACSVQTTSCSSCYTCCDKLRAVGNCRCNKLPFGRAACKAGVKTTCGTCKQVCFGTFLTSCGQQLTSCN